MTHRDLSRWMAMAVAAAGILAFPAAYSLAADAVTDAGKTSPPATHPQTDGVASAPQGPGIVLAGDDEWYADDGGQPSDDDDQGIDNPPANDDDNDGEDYYAGGNAGIVYGPGWYGPGWWYGPGGWFLASGRWYAPPWWFGSSVVRVGPFGHFGGHRHFRDNDRFGFRGRFGGHGRFEDHRGFGGHGRFGMHGGFRGGMAGRR